MPDSVLDQARRLTQFDYKIVQAWDDITGHFTYRII